MRALSTVRYHSAIVSSWPVRSTKWANLAGLIASVKSLRAGLTSFIGFLLKGSVGVIGFLAVEKPLQRVEVAIPGRFLTVFGPDRLVLLLRLPDDFGLHLAQLAPGPHRVELHLRGALEVVEQIIGLSDALAAHRNAVIGHEQDFLVRSEDAGEALAPSPAARRACVGAAVGA